MKRNITLLLASLLIVAGLLLIPQKIEVEINEPPEAGQETNNQATTPLPTPKEFLKQEIEKAELLDRDYLIMHEIIQCESGWEQFWKSGEVKVSNGNIGLAQINHGAHYEEYERLGLDPYDTFQNLTYAVILYKRGGITAWEKWSGHCFLPALAAKGINL